MAAGTAGVEKAVETPELEVRPSQIPGAGSGLFSTKAIDKGGLICIYSGTVLSPKAAVGLQDKSYLMRLGDGVWVDAKPHEEVLARFINDPLVPAVINARFDKRPAEECAHAVATRLIRPGEEIFASYGRWYWLKQPGTKLPARIAAHLLAAAEPS